MRTPTARLKFYIGRTLVVDHTWNLSESLLDQITDDAEGMIEEAIEANPHLITTTYRPEDSE